MRFQFRHVNGDLKRGSRTSVVRREVKKETNLRELEISIAGIEMLSALVGRGMTPSQRKIIGDVLEEIIDGKIPSNDTSKGNLYTEAYGEIFGPLVTCLDLGGNFEIIRLIPPDKVKCPDFLILENNSYSIILQESKALYIDPLPPKQIQKSLDVCNRMRARRNEGKEQLIWPEPESISSNRVLLSDKSLINPLPFNSSIESVSVIAIPDGRLRGQVEVVDNPPHSECDKNNCISPCLFDPEPKLLSLLSTREISQSIIDPNGRDFINWYKTCERAIWGFAHGSFGNAFSKLVDSWYFLELPHHRMSSTSYFLTGLIEYAISNHVFVDFGQIWEHVHRVEQSDFIKTLKTLHDFQGKLEKPKIRETSASEFGKMLLGQGEENVERNIKELMGNWKISSGVPGKETTNIEMSVKNPHIGIIEISMVPQDYARQWTMDNICWAISELLAGGEFPPDIVYEDAFYEEIVQWTDIHKKDIRTFFLGKSFNTGIYPFGVWPYSISKRRLREMHRCCPYCDELACFIEHHIKYFRHGPFFPYWHHHRSHSFDDIYSRGFDSPIAFVTRDARGFLRLPF